MSNSIRSIKLEFEQAKFRELSVLYEKYEGDSRSGVQNLIARYKKQEAKLKEERFRLEQMRCYEKKYQEHIFICGIDEVGRGPLAGPVVAGAVILPKDCEILYINDSKKLSAKKREELYDEILDKAVATGIGMASPATIDKINILQATYEAMRIAVQELPQVPIIKGDAKSVSIATASIIAKVTRDRLMAEYDKILPGYGFAENKGYGSAAHIEALKKLGPTPIHRVSFIKNFVSE